MLILSLLIFCITLEISLFSIRSSNDVWWHLKTGKVIYETKNLPAHDIFTQEGYKYEWVNHEWLSELIFYIVYLIGDENLKVLIFFKAIVLGLTYLYLFYILNKNIKSPIIAFISTLFALWIGKHTFYVRPPIFTYLCLVIFFSLIINYLAKKKLSKTLVVALFFLMLIWTNLHGGAILGLILSFFLILDSIFYLLQKKESISYLKNNLFIFIIVLLGILLNPWGYKTLLLPFKVMQDSYLPKIIYELQPPELKYLPQLKIFIPLFFISLMGKDKPFRIFDMLSVAFFTYESLSSVRHLPLFGLICGYYFGLSFWQAFKVNIKKVKGSFKFVLLLFCIFLYIHLVKIHLPFLKEFLNNKLGYIKENYPEGVCTYIIIHKIPGPYFNDENFSGYLIWRLSPEYGKIFTDVRFDIFKSDFLPYTFAVKEGYTKGKYTLQKTLEKFKPNAIILYKNANGCKILSKMNKWKIAYKDDKFVLFVRKNILDKNNNVLYNKKLKEVEKDCEK